ncbi:MAG: energy-coupling factor transporter transmembrane component T [Acidobacteriota bacterium]
MQIYIYSEKESIIHSIHPMVKIILLLVYFQMAMMFQHPLYVAALLFLLLVIAIAGNALKAVWKFRFILIILFFLSLFLWTFFYRGSMPTDQHFLDLSGKGILFGAGMGLRLSSMMIAGVIFLTTTKVEAFSYGLNKMGIPYRISFALTLAFRLVPLFIDNAFTIIDAQKSRGLQLEKVSLTRKIKGYIPLIIPVFASSLRAADNLALALESKGFGLKEKRTSFVEYRFGIRDFIAIALFMIADTTIIFLRINGHGLI